MKKRIFSGIQPSGNLHIGNYLGAIQQWVGLQYEYESIFCVVDMHAITVPQDPERLREKTLEVAKIYLAAGIDPKQSAMFIQSHVPEHAELMWVLNTITRNSDLTKMTQFKDKTEFDIDQLGFSINSLLEARRYGEILFDNFVKSEWPKLQNIIREKAQDVKLKFNSTPFGLYGYPVLMAADILLYDTDVVPVGEDQVQHVELARDLGKRFNKRFGETFKIPEVKIKKETMRIMALDEPAKKMSKSATTKYNAIGLLDSADDIRAKIKRAVTDSGTEIVYRDDKPALKNLIDIYAALSNKNHNAVVESYTGKGYADFKNGLADVVIEFLKPLQERYRALTDDEVLSILRDGANRIRPLARNKISEVKKKVGFILS